MEAIALPLWRERLTEIEGPDAGDKEDAGLRRAGVHGRDVERAAGEFKFAGICGLEIGVEGLEFWDCPTLSAEAALAAGWALEGVEDLDNVGQEDGDEGLAADEDRVLGVDGLIWDETEAELVLRIKLDLFEYELHWEAEMDARVTELCCTGFGRLLLSDD